MENINDLSENAEEDSESQTESESDYDSDGLRAYTVASNTDFVPTEVKTKIKTKGGKQPEDNVVTGG